MSSQKFDALFRYVLLKRIGPEKHKLRVKKLLIPTFTKLKTFYSDIYIIKYAICTKSLAKKQIL